jgi:hypothetical protein
MTSGIQLSRSYLKNRFYKDEGYGMVIYEKYL